jgi:hypothetical protein
MNKNLKSKQIKKAQRVVEKSLSPGARLSSCARDYLRALIDPFNVTHSACVPTLPCENSQRFTAKIFGICESQTGATAGTPNFAYVALDPHAAAANDENAVFYSIATTQSASLMTDGATGGQTARSNSPYALLFFGRTVTASLKYRIVAAGIRIRYIGAEDTKGGRAFPCYPPDGLSVDALSQTDAETIYDLPSVSLARNQWVDCVWYPASDYSPDYLSAPDTDGPGINMGVYIDAAGPSLSFEFEAYVHLEFVGTLATGKSPMMSDVLGYQAVRNYLASRQNFPARNYRRALAGVEDALSDSSAPPDFSTNSTVYDTIKGHVERHATNVKELLAKGLREARDVAIGKAVDNLIPRGSLATAAEAISDYAGGRIPRRLQHRVEL